MPNIEIHGVSKKEADKIQKQIAESFGDAEYRKDIVVSIANDKVFDIEGQPKPYLRIVTDCVDYEDIAERLNILMMDIEVVLLHKFEEWKN